MSNEIERFQERIGRVEELIRDDDLNALAWLLADLKLSLGMIESFSFFQKQKQRLDRLEKSILEYTQMKEEQIFNRGNSAGATRARQDNADDVDNDGEENTN